jgi:type IV pilus assembly protein PilE
MIQNSTSNHNGFTLIEVMITVVIIGVLAAIAFPAYTKYVQQSRRSDAFTALTQLANNLEKFYSQCSAYTTNITTAGGVNCTTPPAGPGTLGLGATGNQSPNSYYTLSIVTGAPPYAITATANAAGVQFQDTDCRTLTLDSTGAKTSTNSSGTATTSCWKR